MTMKGGGGEEIEILLVLNSYLRALFVKDFIHSSLAANSTYRICDVTTK